MSDRRPRHGSLPLAIGVILLTFGFAFLPFDLGERLHGDWWKYFPVPLLALGVWGLVSPSRHLDRVDGVWLLASGIYCLIGIFGLFGLDWSNAWPIYIIAAGIGVILQQDAFPCPKHGSDRNG